MPHPVNLPASSCFASSCRACLSRHASQCPASVFTCLALPALPVRPPGLCLPIAQGVGLPCLPACFCPPFLQHYNMQGAGVRWSNHTHTTPCHRNIYFHRLAATAARDGREAVRKARVTWVPGSYLPTTHHTIPNVRSPYLPLVTHPQPYAAEVERREGRCEEGRTERARRRWDNGRRHRFGYEFRHFVWRLGRQYRSWLPFRQAIFLPPYLKN